MRDWRPDIVRLVQIKQAIHEADAAGLWEYHLPRVAATQEDIEAAETDLGVELDAGYRELLQFANGWPSFFQTVDLFGTDDLRGGPRLEIARQMLDAVEPVVFAQSRLERDALIPIAASTVDLDIFVMPVVDRRQVPPVVWIAGYEIDRFPTVEDYVLAMIEYNTRDLDALRKQ